MINSATATPVIITNFFMGHGLETALKFKGIKLKTIFESLLKLTRMTYF
jgi:hypothetical protein